jgi:site-specific DNA-methyltransferase (adenine-specific)
MRKTCRYAPADHHCKQSAGDVVADFFAGSGSTLKQAALLGRSGIGVELETERFEQTVSEMRNLLV